MIPVLSTTPQAHPSSARWLEILERSEFSGQIDRSYASRLAVATDNSIYQVLPDAVVFPRNRADVVTLAKLLGQAEHRDVTVVPRGGGTGTNGQALSAGIVVDLSRHMAKVLDFDPRAATIRIEPGVVLDDLNRQIKPAGLFFGPTLSPSNRATLGGMISTNASGKGSRIYGRTADHVLELDVVLIDGTEVTFRDLSLGEARGLARRGDREGQLYAALVSILERHRAAIARQWPNMPRTLTGYDLKGAGQDGRASFNPIVAGSEGTLGFIVGAKLRLLPIPAVRRTIAIAYAEFEHALASAELLLRANPSAIETIDSRILDLAKRDAIWHEVKHLLSFDVAVGAVNLIEFAGDDAATLAEQISGLVDELERDRGKPRAAVGLVVAETASDAAALWELRKKGVGLLGALVGDRRPLPFVEDTAVPPQQLSAYVRDFRKILDEAGLIYGMFGHVDVGCLHVRPALNLRDPADELRLRQISDQVVQLVKRYGGVFWGEHGKGFRSEYVPEFFGDELFGALCELKEAFDPFGQLNPGKLAVVRSKGQRLASVDGPKRGHLDRQIAAESQRHFDVAIHCNGNGQCFSTDPDTVMCPSSKLRRDRVHSPKGRAAMMREWLRQLSGKGFDAGARLKAQATSPEPTTSLLDALARSPETREPDFSHEVYEAMDGCLSCKACATQCPIKVDVPRMKSEFLSLYHQRYARPIRDYLVAALESMLGVLALLPRFFNWWLARAWVRRWMERWTGLVDIPLLSPLNLARELRRRGAHFLTDSMLAELRATPRSARSRYVILLQDAFTTFYEPEVVLATHELMKKLGVVPLVVPFFPSGKALVIKGFLGAFRVLGRRNCVRLNRLAELDIPMVGIEPAVTLCYRDEYPTLLGTNAVRFRVELVQDWLATMTRSLERLSPRRTAPSSLGQVNLFGHCTERTLVPGSQKAWQSVFRAVGVDLSVAQVGCCGMCGVFGLEAHHAQESKSIFAMSWEPKLQAQESHGVSVVTGHSCRSQVLRAQGKRLPHPIELLRELIECAS